MKFSVLNKTILLIVFFFSSLVHAQLLISPTRVVLDERNRSQQVVLINQTNEPRTYRLSWTEKKINKNSKIEDIVVDSVNEQFSASDMYRFSPRQVTLGANEKQTIRLLFRRPKNLDDGEYRSYLKFTPLPKNSADKKSSDNTKILLEPIISFSMPIIARQGSVEASVDINKIQVIKNQQSTSAQVKLTIDKAGKYSTTGNMLVYWQPNTNANEQIVAQVHGYNIYPDQSQYQLSLDWPDFNAQQGSLRVEYIGKKEFNGQVFINKTFDLAPNLTIK